MVDTGETFDTGSDYEDQGDDQFNVFGEDTVGGFMEDLRKYKIIFMIGGPGSGKGTQCRKLVEKYGLTHLSTGELLRRELASGSERSKVISDVMDRGDPAPSGIILELLREAMVASLSNTQGFLIDGYPREVKQGEEFGRRIGGPHLVICMDCSADTMTNRLLRRSQSGPGADDTPKAIAKRLEAYYRVSIPVIAYYEPKTRLHKINAEGTPEEVFLQLCAAMDSIF
ncbi:adenylate kinase isoenzyme 5-like [Carlito syrichta]|uniref:Adenylate kinase isoenzyme 5-like n=1 Tax=Carlito syrichta TaxID=1868482 RepID=A0A3Q0DNE9_CARSF|nr:adenylate kinase isoenzyme 5-like [Carlito syrichta]